MENQLCKKIKMQQHNGHGIVKELNGYDGVIQYNSLKKRDDFIYISNDSKMEKGIKVGDSVFFQIRYTKSAKHPVLVWADNIEKDYSQKGKDMKRKSSPSRYTVELWNQDGTECLEDISVNGPDEGREILKLKAIKWLKKSHRLKFEGVLASDGDTIDTYSNEEIFEASVRKKSNPRKKAEFDWESTSTTNDLASFFKKKFPSMSLKDIKEEIKDSLNTSNARFASDGGASVTVDGEEFNLIENHDRFHDTAIDYVKNMLDDEPESFNQSFIQNHIYITDTDKSIIAGEEADARYDDLSSREIEKEYERKYGENIEDEDGDPDYDAMREELRNDYDDEVEKELDDPIGYFVDQQGIYTLEELLKASFIRIDTEEAAEAAVSEDGEAHFLSHYDGNYEETNGGIIVMRE